VHCKGLTHLPFQEANVIKWWLGACRKRAATTYIVESKPHVPT